jgi:tetratricopeptide (TPR) repeat protein
LLALPAAGAAKLRRTDALYIDAIHRTLIRDFAGAIRAYTTLAAGAAPAERATVYVDLGRVREATQETGKALEAYREAIRLDPQNAAAHLRAAILLSRRREPDAAVEFAAADSLYQALSNTEGQAEVFYQRGYSAARDDRRAEARALLEKAVQLAKAISSDQQEIAATLQLGFLADLDGDPAKAEEIAGAAVERARRTGMAYFAARGLAAVGEAQFLKREYKRAEANLQEALEISRKSQMPRSEARALFGLANLHQTIGRPEAAIREIDLAIAYYQNAGFKIETLTARMIKARAARDLGRETEAIEAFQDALPLATALGDRRYMGIAEQGIASVLSLQENWPAALPHYARYYEIASGSADPNAIGRALAGQAGALWRLGRSMEAEGKLAELGGLKMTRVAAEQLSAWIAQQRIEIALQFGRQGEAAAVARRLREIKAGDTSDLAADLAMARCAGGVALALTGAVREGKDLCEQGLAALSGEADRLLLAVAQIQMAQILLHNGESGPALEQAKRACDALGGATRPESLWRAWVIAARAYRVAGERVHAAEALETAKARLADLRRSWPADEFNSYEKRTDISQLLSDFQR